MNIFPYFILRITGGSFDNIIKLNIIASKNYSNEIEKQLEVFKEIQSSLNNNLYHAIQSAKKENQNYLLNLKRDIYNGKNISSLIDRAQEIVTDELKLNLTNYNILYLKIAEIKKTGELEFKREITESRKAFKLLIQNEHFKKGLFLSSEVLFQRIEKYSELDIYKVLRKKDLQTELGLTKYLNRFLTKTSPFGTFTNLVAGELAEI